MPKWTPHVPPDIVALVKDKGDFLGGFLTWVTMTSLQPMYDFSLSLFFCILRNQLLKVFRMILEIRVTKNSGSVKSYNNSQLFYEM